MVFQIRQSKIEDLSQIKEVILELKHLYPGIEEWWDKKEEKKLRNNKSICLVVESEGKVSGVAISGITKKPGKNNVVKLKTFYLQESIRHKGIGDELLEQVLEYWVRQNANKIYVTFAEEERKDLEGYFERYGFFHSGMSSELYRPNSTEHVMEKIFSYNRLEESNFADFIRKYLFKLRGYTLDGAPTQFLATKKIDQGNVSYIVTIVTNLESINNTLEDIEKKSKQNGKNNYLFISFYPLDPMTKSNTQINILDGYDIENAFYPVQLQRKKFAGIIQPIKPEYSKQLFFNHHQTTLAMPEKVKMRSDNVYYRSAIKGTKAMRGSVFVIYQSQSTKTIVGEARIKEVITGNYEELFKKYGKKGILTIEDLKKASDKNGTVVLFLFGKTINYPEPLPLALIKQEVIEKFNPITEVKISQIQLNKIRQLCGYTFPWEGK